MSEEKKTKPKHRTKPVRGVYRSDAEEARKERGEESSKFRLNSTESAIRRLKYPGLTLTQTLRLWAREKLLDELPPNK